MNPTDHESCLLYPYCITQKHEWESCNDMVSRYNARLLLPPEFKDIQPITEKE